jgi:hypothetical protein
MPSGPPNDGARQNPQTHFRNTVSRCARSGFDSGNPGQTQAAVDFELESSQRYLASVRHVEKYL